jgi:hypothetical protein
MPRGRGRHVAPSRANAVAALVAAIVGSAVRAGQASVPAEAPKDPK